MSEKVYNVDKTALFWKLMGTLFLEGGNLFLGIWNNNHDSWITPQIQGLSRLTQNLIYIWFNIKKDNIGDSGCFTIFHYYSQT